MHSESRNLAYGTEICNWHKDHAHAYTFGRSIASPDFDNTSCVVLWGHNPSATWLDHATATTAARRHGARIIVVDPRRAGFAARADQWLRVRPGSDGALALGIAGEMIRNNWFDADFVRDWTNGSLLVRADTQRFLRAGELATPPIGAQPEDLLAWDAAQNDLVAYSIPRRTYARSCKKELDASLELFSTTGDKFVAAPPLVSIAIFATPIRPTGSRRETDVGRRSSSYRNSPPALCIPSSQLLCMVGRWPAHQCHANRQGNIASYGINRQL